VEFAFQIVPLPFRPVIARMLCLVLRACYSLSLLLLVLLLLFTLLLPFLPLIILLLGHNLCA
jgi:hypothetical protein